MSDVTQTVLVDDRTEALRMKRFLLTIVEPDGSHRHRVFGRRRVTIGSSPDNDVVLEDPAVSRTHAEIRVDAGGYRLVDAGSKNGTRVGDMRVGDAYLATGALIGIGTTEIRFETTDEDVEVVLSGRSRFGRMVGKALVMRDIFAVLERVAPTDAPVLIEGPSGVGKEDAAEAVHAHSDRRGREFVVFDCGAIGSEALEAELFGVESADGDIPGALAQAAGATLYIDDLTELPADVQARFARSLDKGTYHKVGSARTLPIEARILAGTDRNLRREIEQGDFREDLFYQLAVVHVVIPPLRERAEDIPLLVEHFLDTARKRIGDESLNITYATMERLKAHAWPGNVRELKNFIDRAVALSGGDGGMGASARFLQPGAPTASAGEPEAAVEALMRSTGVDVAIPFKDAKGRLVEAFERAYWTHLLERTDGNVSKAARIAGVHRKSVEYILKKLDIDRKEVAS